MKPKGNGLPRAQISKGLQAEGPNWILIAGGALLSTLSMRLGYKLKQVLDTKEVQSSSKGSRGSTKSTEKKKLVNCHLHSDAYCLSQNDDGCYTYMSGTKNLETKQQRNQTLNEHDMALSPVTVSAHEYNKENGVIWQSSPDRLELPQKPFHHSNSSDSPCVSDSGSDIFSKREVIQKLRQQLKRRDDMILEMQDQIAELQNSLSAQLSHSTHVQSLLDAANRDLFDSEREIQRLRKAIADHCVGQVSAYDKPPTVNVWPTEGRNGHASGYVDVESNWDSSEKGRDGDKIELLRKEVCDLKEVIEGKDYLLLSFKEQKTELSMKIKELQQRLDSQLPNIL
ncbi:hypothetical protein DCAR_0935925 [Daucus carota subsp. sativus]|uniref:Uncharacterized protein n=1 Tax=Daucus carota subsp. sativus TaxID=79200 RepID=A0AAF0Y1B9_DAUCS|nr:PREDICTED: uncharacterized protein LOC108202935 isoform X2 [Daucus carota subsp. sativus]WOH16374.1 hypothetical protein DCAR_0935925 [Daucus carota subsp. sativus]